MSHATSLADLISRRTTDTNRAPVRFFNGEKTVTRDVYLETHRGGGHVFHLGHTEYEPVYSSYGDYMPLSYSEDQRISLVPIWDQPDPDPTVIAQIQTDVRQVIPLDKLIQAIPYEDASQVAMNLLYNRIITAAICMIAQDYSADAVAQYILDYLKQVGAERALMLGEIDNMAQQFGITGIKFV